MERMLSLYMTASISASVIILILLAAKPVWKNRFRKSWQYYIWLLVVLRLLIPLSPAPGLIGSAMAGRTAADDIGADRVADGNGADRAAANGIGADTAAEYGNGADRAAANGIGVDTAAEDGNGADRAANGAMADSSINKDTILTPDPDRGGISGQNDSLGRNSIPDVQPSVSASEGDLGLFVQSLLPYVWVCWLVPAALMMFYRVFCYCRYMSMLRQGRLPAGDPVITTACREAGCGLGLRREIPVYFCPAVTSPMLAGAICPGILLPKRYFSESELYYIFRHELIHFKRKDVFYKWLMQLTVCLHWFNPLVYVMARECDRLCELSCDEAVISDLSPERRMDYGDTLISFLRDLPGSPRHRASILLCESAHTLKERLGEIMKTKKSTGIQRMSAMVLTVLFAGLLLGLGGFQAEAEDGEGMAQPSFSGAGPNEFRENQEKEKGKDGYSRMITGFFANQYGLELEWGKEQPAYDTNRQITVDDVYTVWFTEETKRYADNSQVIEAVRLAILEQRQKQENGSGAGSSWERGFIMTSPVVKRVEGPYEDTYDQLAVRFYEEDKLIFFAPVIERASRETQDGMLRRAYDDKNIPYFSSCTGLLTEDGKLEYMKMAYTDDQLPFFGMLVDDSKPEVIKEFAEQAFKEDNIPFYALCCDELSAAEKKDYVYRSYEEGRIECLSMVLDSLDADERLALAERARQENKTEFYYMISAYDD